MEFKQKSKFTAIPERKSTSGNAATLAKKTFRNVPEKDIIWEAQVTAQQ